MNKVICPHCGAEYLPAEIFVPSAFFGKPRNIDKDSTGRILGYNGTREDLKENFKCDFCDRKFSVVANVDYKTSIRSVGDYSTKINKVSLFMKED